MRMYFIALLPPPGIERSIESFKLEIKESYHARNALKLPAHITLQIPFKMPEEEEETLSKILTSVAQETKSFEVRLSGFDCFKPRVIFIKIADHGPIVNLHNKISTALKDIGIKGEGMNQGIHPHINIASRDLKKENFPNAWLEFREREFSDSFLGDHFCLFKHNGKTWDLEKKFILEQ